METMSDNQDMEELKEKIDNEENVGEITIIIGQVADRNTKLAEKLVNNLDLGKLKSKLDAENDVQEIARCVAKIAYVCEGYAAGIFYAGGRFVENLVRNMNIKKLKDKIDGEEDIGKIVVCIDAISEVNSDVARKLTRSLDAEKLKNKIDGEKDIGKIQDCLWSIGFGSDKVAEKIVRGLDAEKLGKKMGEEKDVRKIGLCIEAIHRQGNCKLAAKLATQLNPDNAKTPDAKKFIINLKTRYLKT